MTLTFDLLIPNVDRFMALPRRPFVAICIEIGSFVTDRWTSGQVENFMPPASLNCSNNSSPVLQVGVFAQLCCC